MEKVQNIIMNPFSRFFGFFMSVSSSFIPFSLLNFSIFTCPASFVLCSYC